MLNIVMLCCMISSSFTGASARLDGNRLSGEWERHGVAALISASGSNPQPVEIATGASLKKPYSPKPNGQRFYTRLAITELIATSTLTATDAVQTCRNLAHGGREDWLPAQSCTGTTAILAGEMVSQELLAYALYRHGHTKLAYMVRLFKIEDSVHALLYSKRHGAW